MVNQPPPYPHGPQPYPLGAQHNPMWASSPPPAPKKPMAAWVWIVGIIGGLLVLGMIGSAVSGKTDNRAAPVTTAPQAHVPVVAAGVESSAPSARNTTTVPPVADLAIPDVVGKNGAVADDVLKKAGFTEVSYASASPGVDLVVMLSNWTVVSVEPGAGTVVSSDSVVVLTMTKKNR
ncbi:PASTA domain-containing protein [Nocardia brasiliensis]|uniref:PASTA domain-containing protein n=1 Tax=Nocardia brasiliensis TaxID=37326 RepID=UPI002453FEA2|nr:PASTA domain-containing protein [Nocardia brasiliensis]